ncbi:MAG: hypothetical protein HWE20_03925 [Gammaproteobacteria bacterium]|nr:hypothetical protein [Gammaproteobacteria bacterium]
MATLLRNYSKDITDFKSTSEERYKNRPVMLSNQNNMSGNIDYSDPKIEERRKVEQKKTLDILLS